MRAVAVREFKAAPELMDLPTPTAGAGEVVVRVEDAGVNPLDWKIIDGFYDGRRRHLFPLILGSDGAGTVASVDPSVRRFRVGDRVYGQFLHDPVGTGTYAEWTVVPESIGIARIPDSWSAVDAAALPTSGMTSLLALERLGAGPGHVIVVAGASGGIGSFVTQLASAQGAHVIGLARGESLDRLRALGAREAVALDTGDPLGELRAEYPKGVDGLLDLMHPAPEFAKWAGLVGPNGVAVSTVGAAHETSSHEDGPHQVNVNLEPTTELLERVTALMERLHLRAPVERRISLEEAARAVEESRRGRARGKTVIHVGT